MVVLEHDHAREVVAVGVDPADEHPVLFDEAEARRRLARARDNALVPIRAREVLDLLRPGRKHTAGEHMQDSGANGMGRHTE